MADQSYDSFETYQARKRFLNLDGLRFICISAVIWHHSAAYTAEGLRFLERGFLGVDFFFVLSGFLITSLMLREESRQGKVSFSGFYWRRFLRIIPVYFFVVTICTLYVGVIRGDAEAFERAPYYYLFLSNFLAGDTQLLGVTWSLSVEEQYYLVWPLILVFMPRKILPWFVVGAIALNLLTAIGAFDWISEEPYQNGRFILKLPSATYSPILMGSLVAVMLHYKRSYEVLAKAFGYHWMPAILGFVLFMLCWHLPNPLMGWGGFFIHLVMSGFMIALLTKEANVATPFLTMKPIVRIGEISYGIYLYHLIALHGVMTIQREVFDTANLWVNLFGMYALSIVIAELSYRTLEAFFRDLRHKPPFFIAPSTKVQGSAR
ncbi:acyltransferase [Parvularcula sp. ZS-1/3]|uniref:Acyltransferase n=1 Tax=Parvularcula mediterranea TaxID=2732508 RepID=A0A7Y3RN40_9PROT|nr:acyltransferase [Parvularcula mediterranea]NNU16317.1 acyltransferase [Parvularcula mediterranea]